MLDVTYVSDCPGNIGGWKERHMRAVSRGTPVTEAIRAWVDYANFHHARFDSPIGEDYVLGPAWAEWGKALRTLLNGECGAGIDCGTLDTILVTNLLEQGFEV